MRPRPARAAAPRTRATPPGVGGAGLADTVPPTSYTAASDVRSRPAAVPRQAADPLEVLLQGQAQAQAVSSTLRKTKLVCTIGPPTANRDAFFRLAEAGMNVCRLNMSHGTHESHRAVMDLVREYNTTGQGVGPEVRSGDLAEPIEMTPGQRYTFTIEEGANGGGWADVSPGDVLLVDGGIISFKVVGVKGADVECECEVVDPGVMQSRRHLNVRGKSATLPAVTDKDWLDLKFGVEQGVDYYALSFVQILAKIESADSVKALDDILDAADGAMVARGDLGAELPVEEVPYWQAKIGCRRRGKPVIVATNMLESMINNPAPTRAEVSDIAIAVREGADAVMLSGETAYGRFPAKTVQVQSTVALRTELSMMRYQGTRRYGSEEAPPIDWIVPPNRRPNAHSDAALTEIFAYHAATMANTVHAPLLVFSRQGGMPSLLSHFRPDYPIFAFCDNHEVMRHLALYHGVIPFHLEFPQSADDAVDAALRELVARGHLTKGRLVAIVQSGRVPIWRKRHTHAIQVRRVEKRHLAAGQELDSIEEL
ncbi:pyruvate kinase isozyme, chloroplastic [Raphidocelis subcapitata]|uniref:Pyruvate kinase n=1 Tax=Raphidocelis subcapitata TaxID=307507 RepID=A0A2V0NM22_9CHLO|nr:pyruvate kinase isozyme, chloroplastic [Raphidocelis subcapitata]|eukprot:GBF88518.1 pyruvate kinase isozyme, chloroplastic [Raphidocelis subcapitata]